MIDLSIIIDCFARNRLRIRVSGLIMFDVDLETFSCAAPAIDPMFADCGVFISFEDKYCNDVPLLNSIQTKFMLFGKSFVPLGHSI